MLNRFKQVKTGKEALMPVFILTMLFLILLKGGMKIDIYCYFDIFDLLNLTSFSDVFVS